MNEILSPVSVSKSYKVSNRSGKEIVVLNAYSKNKDAPGSQFYARDLVMLQDVKEQTMIASGADATLTITGTQDDMLYTLIFAQADNLFPLKITEVPTTDDTDFAAEVTEKDRENMQLAAKFYQTVTALPSYKLAKDYAAALADKDLSKTATFFSNTDGYQALTLNMVKAVETYYDLYPFIWADYKVSKMYNLYAFDGTRNISAGSITIINKSKHPARTDKSIPDFKITFTQDENATSTTLYYSKGRFVDNRESDSPAVSIHGLFLLQTQLMGDSPDIIFKSGLRGTVNKNEVVGYDDRKLVDDKGNWISLGNLLHPAELKDWLQLAGIIIAVTASLAILSGATIAAIVIKKIRSRQLPKDESNDDEFETEKEDELYRERLHKEINEQSEKTTDKLRQKSINEVKAIAAEQQTTVERLVKFGANKEVLAIYDNLEKINTILDDTSTKNFEITMNDLMKRVKSNAANIETRTRNLSNKYTAEEMSSVNESSQLAVELTSQLEKREEFRERYENEETGYMEEVDWIRD